MRKLRRDAAENLDRVLDVATTVFAENGFDTSIEVVAQRADVGLGTIYRRFRNKEALIDELARRLLKEAVEIGERHLKDPDGVGIFPYFFEIGALLASQRGIVGRIWNVPGAKTFISRSRRAQARLLRSAQEQKLIRPEVVPEDIAVICWSVSGVLDVTRGLSVPAWRRHLEICIAGLLPSETRLQQPTITSVQMNTIIFGEKPSSRKVTAEQRRNDSRR